MGEGRNLLIFVKLKLYAEFFLIFQGLVQPEALIGAGFL